MGTCLVSWCFCWSTSIAAVTLEITTDQTSYGMEDTIHITLILESTESSVLELPFKNDCEAAYFLGKSSSMTDTNFVCDGEPHSVQIAPYTSHRWEWDHILVENPMASGITPLQGLLFIRDLPWFTDPLLIQIGSLTVPEPNWGVLPAIDTLFIVGGCMVPALLLQPDSSLAPLQSLRFSDFYEPYSLYMHPTPGWEIPLESIYFWVYDDSISYTYTASVESAFGIDPFTLGAEQYLWYDGPQSLRVALHDSTGVVDTMTQVLDQIIYGAVQPANIHESAKAHIYPNPFNTQVTLAFTNSVLSDLRMTVYDIHGRECYVRDDPNQGAGFHQMIWSGKDGQGNPVTSGVYILSVSAEDFHVHQKVVLIK